MDIVEREVTAEERQLFLELKDKHRRAKPFLVGDTFVVVRMASPGELHRYKDKVAKSFGAAARGGASMSEAQRELALCAIVHPTERDAVKALLDAQPGFEAAAADAADALANAGIKELDLEGN